MAAHRHTDSSHELWYEPEGHARRWRGIDLPHVTGDDDAVWVPGVMASTRIAMGLGMLALGFYAAFILNPANRGELIPYLALVIAEVILIANTLAVLLTAITTGTEPPESSLVIEMRRELMSGIRQPSIDVVITVYGEPLDVIERTVTGARDMHVPHRTIVCDDRRSDEVRDLCIILGVEYVRRHDRDGAKAGNANRALQRLNGEYVAIFDADHVPHPDFLLVTVPHMADPDVAFVQCPQAYRIERDSFVERAAAESQRLFYEAVCPGKNRFNAAFHVGTNAVFRRIALDSVGGFYEDTHSEDIWTSLRMHQRGWKSIFLPHIVARGLSPATVQAHLAQQFRWASGSFEILLRGNPMRSKNLTFDQRWQYMCPPLHFLQSFSNFVYLLLPAMFLLFGSEPLSSGSSTWLVHFLPLWALTQALLWLQTGAIRIRPIFLSMINSPTHVRAFFAVAFRRDPVWKATNQLGDIPTVLETMKGQVALLLVNVTAIVVGLSAIEDAKGTAISVALCGLHVLVLGYVVVQAVVDRRHLQPTSKKHERSGPAGNSTPLPATESVS